MIWLRNQGVKHKILLCRVYFWTIPDIINVNGCQTSLNFQYQHHVQEFFICDWWFNFDCAEAEDFYSKNDENAAAAQAVDEAGMCFVYVIVATKPVDDDLTCKSRSNALY